MAFSQQTKPLSIFEILCLALKLPTKNSTLVLLLSFLASYVLFVFFTLSIQPINADFISNSMAIASLDPNSPEYAIVLAAIVKDIKELFGIEAIFIITSSIVSSLTTIATIRAFSTTVSDYLLCRNLKGPMITMLYVALFSWGCSIFLVAAFGILLMLVYSGSTMILVVSGVTLALLGTILYLYLTMVWSVSTVISILEEGCYGLSAISKAREVIRGRRGQGFALVMIQIILTGGVVYVTYKIEKAYLDPSSTVVQLGIGLVLTAIGVVMVMFHWAVIVVFYCDCTGGGRAEMEGGFMYGSVPSTAEALLDEV